MSHLSTYAHCAFNQPVKHPHGETVACRIMTTASASSNPTLAVDFNQRANEGDTRWV